MFNLKKLSRTLFVALFSLFLVGTHAASVRAADGDDRVYDEYDTTARVARISFLDGEVSLRRADSDGWERATRNMPLVEGDTLATGRDGRFEIQIDGRKFVRLGVYSSLTLNTLRDDGIAMSLAEGTATVRLARFDRDKEYFEIDAPNATFAAQKIGLYRIDVTPAANRDDKAARVNVTVRDSGLARIYSQTSGFTLRSGRRAELIASDTDASDWEFYAASDFDSWDDWNSRREREVSRRWSYENHAADIRGAEELNDYGSWSYTNDYGWLWQPSVTYTGNYSNWTPYRYGYWNWCQPYGWSWVGYESFGWYPYHYGRWVYYNNGWYWTPHGYYYQTTYWRPALVAFTYVPSAYGEYVAWYPLGYYHRDPFARNYTVINNNINNVTINNNNRRAPLTPLNRDEIANLQRTNPALLRAVTTLPANNFGGQNGNVQAANADIARRAVSLDPVRGRLPVAPPRASNGNLLNANGGNIPRAPQNTNGAVGANANGISNANNMQRRGLVINNPVTQFPPRQLGASTRTPGVSLDNTLRGERMRTSSAVVSSDRVRRLENGEANTLPRTNSSRPTASAPSSTGTPSHITNRNNTSSDNSSSNNPPRPTTAPKSTLRINNPYPRERRDEERPTTNTNARPTQSERIARPPVERRPPSDVPRTYERPSSPPPSSSPRIYEQRQNAPAQRSSERPSAPSQTQSAPRSNESPRTNAPESRTAPSAPARPARP
ncbi:MAG: hypothetical protein NVSMB56_02040 [Pyrinomonadaceae bacterium]